MSFISFEFLLDLNLFKLNSALSFLEFLTDGLRVTVGNLLHSLQIFFPLSKSNDALFVSSERQAYACQSYPQVRRSNYKLQLTMLHDLNYEVL